jgi:hypothetical protein
MWGTKTESTVVRGGTREGEVAALNPAGRVAREFCAKNAATRDFDGDGRAKKNSIFSGFFRFIFCRVFFQHSAKSLPSTRDKALGKVLFAYKNFAE